MSGRRRIPQPCAAPGCQKIAKGDRLCAMHRARLRRRGDLNAQNPRLIAPPGSSLMRRLLAGVVTDDGCWIWGRRIISGSGYGGINVGGQRDKGAHVAMWEQIHQRPVPAGMLVCHICDVRACINPAHLYLGTRSDNARDMTDRQRQARGERHGHAKLTEAEVLAIRQDPRPIRCIAQDYGISAATVSSVKRRRSWTWLEAAS